MQIVRRRSYFIHHNFKLGFCLFCVFWLSSCCHKSYTIVQQQRARPQPFSPMGWRVSSAASAPRRTEVDPKKSPDLDSATAASKADHPGGGTPPNTATLQDHEVILWPQRDPCVDSSLYRNPSPRSSALPGISLHSFLCHTYGSWRKSNKVLIPIGLIGVKLHHFSTASHRPSESSSINRGQ